MFHIKSTCIAGFLAQALITVLNLGNATVSPYGRVEDKLIQLENNCFSQLMSLIIHTQRAASHKSCNQDSAAASSDLAPVAKFWDV